MASLEQRKSLIDQINHRLEILLNHKPENLVGLTRLGTALSFEEVEPTFRRAKSFLEKLQATDLIDCPYIFLNELNSTTTAMAGHYANIANFKPSQGNAKAARDRLISALGNAFDKFLLAALSVLNYKMILGNELSEHTAQLKKKKEELEQYLSQRKKDSDEVVNKLKETLENAQAFTAESGVAKHSRAFVDQADSHEVEAKKWLKYTIMILCFIGLSAILLVVIGKNLTERTEIIQLTVSKIVYLSALFYGLAIASRNYKAHKHNAVINLYKQNALQTFETFANAAGSDEQTKNAILLETTRAIFATPQTGYLDVDPENDSNNKIIEIIKSVGSKKET